MEKISSDKIIEEIEKLQQEIYTLVPKSLHEKVGIMFETTKNHFLKKLIFYVKLPSGDENIHFSLESVAKCVACSPHTLRCYLGKNVRSCVVNRAIISKDPITEDLITYSEIYVRWPTGRVEIFQDPYKAAGKLGLSYRILKSRLSIDEVYMTNSYHASKNKLYNITPKEFFTLTFYRKNGYQPSEDDIRFNKL